jgi:hypothetical protein
MLMLARGSIWSAAVTQFHLANLEMLLELAPFLLGGLAVLCFRANGSPLVEERPIGSETVFLRAFPIPMRSPRRTGLGAAHKAQDGSSSAHSWMSR